MGSKVIELSDDNFEAVLSESSVVLVDFWAPWCGPCRMLAPILNELAEESNGEYEVCKLDVDENSSASMKFSVRSLPTMVIFKDGVEIERFVGFMQKSAIKEKISKYLDKR